MKVYAGVHKHRTRSSEINEMIECSRVIECKSSWRLTLCSLPEELLLSLLKRLHIRELLSMRQAHPCFRYLVDAHSSVWTAVSFKDCWPTQPNIRHFEKAAEHGNLEALIKLGIAYLYNEGLPGDFEGRRITANGEKAAEMFCRVETLTPHTPPFTWMFIRPPWASAGACCKQFVFQNMLQHADKHDDASVLICVAKTLQLLGGPENEAAMVMYLERAVAKQPKCLGTAAYMLWKHNAQNKVCERGTELHWLRMLRDIVSSTGDIDAQLALCRCYAGGRYGGIPPSRAAAFVRGIVAESSCTNAHAVYTSNSLTPSMRYILVDWLVEVACMKGFSSITLHMAVNMVDRYLRVHRTMRSRLQLLGVSSMVLCSRFLGKDIMTIREAAWLTDNTYKYEDVVRMMGEITTTLRAHVRVTTSLDFVELYGIAVANDRVTQCLAEYMCELVLLQCPLLSDTHSQAHVAATCMLLARIVQKKDYPWSNVLCDFTGYALDDLVPCALQLHEQCFPSRAMVDHRQVVLQAVGQRYRAENMGRVSEIHIPPRDELCVALGSSACHLVEVGVDSGRAEMDCRRPHDLIQSPSSHAAASRQMDRFCEDSGREQAATPVLPPGDPQQNNILNESVLSGYDGDKEDEGESFAEFEEPEADIDLASLWRFDMFASSTSSSTAPSPARWRQQSPAAAWTRSPGGQVWVHSPSPLTTAANWGPRSEEGTTQRVALRTLTNDSIVNSVVLDGKRKAGERQGREKRPCLFEEH